MRNSASNELLVLGLTFVFGSHIGSSFAQVVDLQHETQISSEQAIQFESRPGVTTFVPHGIPFESSKLFTIQGKKDEHGYCGFMQVMRGNINDVTSSRELGSVDIAVEPKTCEKIVERGFFPVGPRGMMPVPKRSPAVSVPVVRPRASSATQEPSWTAQNTAPIASIAAAPPSATGGAFAFAGGVYTEWNDGDAPLMSTVGPLG